jgi:hypothetical protein
LRGSFNGPPNNSSQVSAGQLFSQLALSGADRVPPPAPPELKRSAAHSAQSNGFPQGTIRMKRCPKCNHTYPDDSLNFCLEDGVVLVSAGDPDATLLSESRPATKAFTAMPSVRPRRHMVPLLIVLLVVILGGTLTVFVLAIKRAPPISGFNGTLHKWDSLHQIYLVHKAGKDLHEVNVTVTIVGDDGEPHSEKKYFALWSNDQINSANFLVRNVNNVQKISMVGTCTEGHIDYTMPNPPDDEKEFRYKPAPLP